MYVMICKPASEYGTESHLIFYTLNTLSTVKVLKSTEFIAEI